MLYLRMRGLVPRQLLVVEFCETAGEDGLYRKYSIFRIGDSYVPRYLHIGRHWMTKSGTSDADVDRMPEVMAYLRENPHAAWAREIFEMAHIEYGRLDYGLRRGRPQAWEINLTPVLAGDPNRPPEGPAGQRARLLAQSAKEYAHALMREAFQRIDPGPLPGDNVHFEFSPALEEQARRERRGIDSLSRRRQWIARIAATPGFRAIGPLLRRRFGA